ncbi:hypothetical protein VM1G_10463 [Cytospora mali]|uniref:Fucose-specific lectin n=1 Tax=Cytospora mali TaxID=578113 RepID=A0A194VIG8_CYTMA|nr:hypothetical protein VM1G_10463 [Valsa mali]
MTRLGHMYRLITCYYFLACITRVACGSYAAFMYQPLGTQLIVLDSAGQFTYSLCNSNSTPVYPTDSPLILPIAVQPKNGSNIAAVGWYEDGEVYADVFWQNTGFDLEHERFKCNMNNGTYTIVSHDSPNNNDLSDNSDMPEISLFTGLAAVRLSSSDGTRLFFHDTGASLQQLEYTSSNTWKYIGQVNPDGHLQGPSLGAAAVDGSTKMYTVEPRSDNNIEIAKTTNGDIWDIETTPQPLSNNDTTSTSTQNFTIDDSVTVLAGLQAWGPGISSLGLAIDQDESKYIYYIGSDKTLHYVTSQDGVNLGSWSVENSLDIKYWPLADDADGEFAVASDPSSYDIRIYYMSGGDMIEVSRTGKDTWAEAQALPTKATATVSGSSPAEVSGASSPTATAGNSNKDEKSGDRLSLAATYGIGVAAGISALAIAVTWGGCYFSRHISRQRQQAHDQIALAQQEAGPGTFGDNTPLEYGNFARSQLGPSHLDEDGTPKEMGAGMATPSSRGHTARDTTSPREHTSGESPVYELPTYTQADRSVKHELPSSDPESMPSSRPDSMRQSPPVPSPPSVYNSGRLYAPPPADYYDS